MNLDRHGWAPLAVVASAYMLWGTNAVGRTGLLATLTSPAIVFRVHVALVAATAWLFWKDRASLRELDRGASALAMVLLT